MGELIMGIREPSSNKLNKVLWSEKGNIGKDWKYASVTLKYAKRFHVCMYVCVYVCVSCVYVCMYKYIE